MRIFLTIGWMLLTMVSYGQSMLTIGPNQKFIHIDESSLEIIESIDPGTTLYSLGRKYGVSVEAILGANPDLDPVTIPLGIPVHIPVDRSRIRFSPPSPESINIWLSYRVQPKETLYRISKIYLGVSPDTIAKLNPGSLSGITIGQVLHIGWLIPASEVGGKINPDNPMDTLLSMPLDFIRVSKENGMVVKEQKGLAVWKDGALTSHYFVLHPTARIGSYMEITNPMLHRTITAKVAGNIPQGLYQNHVGIVVSPSTARALGILDKQFFAKWRYVE